MTQKFLTDHISGIHSCKRSCFRRRVLQIKKENQIPLMQNLIFLVRQKGLEPPTYWFVASHSIQLSYCRMSCSR